MVVVAVVVFVVFVVVAMVRVMVERRGPTAKPEH